MRSFNLHRIVLAAILSLSAPFASAQTPVTLASNGVWTWFNDPRAVFKDGLLYFGYVRQADGKAVMGVYDPATASPPTTMWTSNWSETDDHNNPGLLPLADGRMMGFYARHLANETTFNWRLSTSITPDTPGEWGAEQTYMSGQRVSYVNPFQLTSESGRIYNFIRNLNYNPTFVTTDNFGANWSTAKILIQSGSGGTIRPYVKYSSNGNDRIDFFYSDGHPRDLNNSLYHGYYQNGSLYKTDGTFLKTLANAPLLHDSGERGSVVYQYSAAATPDPNSHIPTGRAWCWDLAYGSGGSPIATFSVQRDPVGGSSWSDDRIYYYYARWVPGTGWQKRFIAHAGRPLYESEDDYAGGIAVDPLNPNVIYISTNALNPFNLSDISNIPLKPNARYEIYRGVTADGGLTFTWQPITQNSATDNLRPYVPRHRTDYTYALVWFAGTYSSYTSWNTQVKGLFTNNQPPSIQISSPAGGSASLGSVASILLLAASVTDDGFPTPSSLTLTWSVLSGPTGAAFSAPGDANTDVTFTQPGDYVLRLTANDGASAVTADISVTILTGSQPAGAKLWLQLDESAGTSAADSSGTANPGVLSGAATWQPSGGRLGGALDFDGNSGSLAIPDASTLDPGSVFTLAYWVRVDAYNSSGSGLVSKRDGPTTNNQYTTFLNGNASDSAGYKRITVDIGGNDDRFTSSTQIALNTWYHVALVYDGSRPTAQRAALWINGALDKTSPESSSSVPNSAATVRAGLTHLGVSTYLNGQLDDIRLYQRPLSPGEIGQLADSLNLAPLVSAGIAPSATNGITAALDGSASDDGNGGPLTVLWSVLAGPGAVDFTTQTEPDTTVTFNEAGNYILRISASDTQVQTVSDLSITVTPNPNVFQDWIGGAYPGETDEAIIGPEADPEEDGTKNMLEFALGMDPAAADSHTFVSGQPGLPGVSVDEISGDEYLTLSVRRPIGRLGITYAGRVSGNLDGWGDGVQVGSPTPNGDGSETVIFRDTVPIGEPDVRFIRLEITHGG